MVARFILALLLVGTLSSRAAVILLTPDLAQSTAPPVWGGAVANLLNDPFAYNPASPTAIMPATYFSDGSTGYHGAIVGDATIAFTMDTIYRNLAVDLYGRDSFFTRDNNLTIQFFWGSWNPGDMVDQITGFDVSDVTQHGRVTASSSEIIADRFLVTSPFPLPNGHENTGVNYFTMLEVRAIGSVAPEPSRLCLMLAAGLLGVLRRRRSV